jgi:hypothetical protein
MKQIDGNIWVTSMILERIKELDLILDMLEARNLRYKSHKLNGTIYLTKRTHALNVDLLRRINPEYYRHTKSTLLRQ